MKNLVVHLKRDEFEVRIDRATRWGNPFVIGRDGDRMAVIAKYRVWLHEQIERGAILIADVAELHGKTLGCWCAPEPCHGDVLVNAARWAAEYLDHEAACNTAEDLDCGHIFPWRVEQVKAVFAAGGTTAIDEDGELYLVTADGSRA